MLSVNYVEEILYELDIMILFIYKIWKTNKYIKNKLILLSEMDLKF